jgi:hypothetical protein
MVHWRPIDPSTRPVLSPDSGLRAGSAGCQCGEVGDPRDDCLPLKATAHRSDGSERDTDECTSPLACALALRGAANEIGQRR